MDFYLPMQFCSIHLAFYLPTVTIPQYRYRFINNYRALEYITPFCTLTAGHHLRYRRYHYCSFLPFHRCHFHSTILRYRYYCRIRLFLFTWVHLFVLRYLPLITGLFIPIRSHLPFLFILPFCSPTFYVTLPVLFLPSTLFVSVYHYHFYTILWFRPPPSAFLRRYFATLPPAVHLVYTFYHCSTYSTFTTYVVRHSCSFHEICISTIVVYRYGCLFLPPFTLRSTYCYYHSIPFLWSFSFHSFDRYHSTTTIPWNSFHSRLLHSISFPFVHSIPFHSGFHTFHHYVLIHFYHLPSF